jgi:hypothetical protein
MKPILATLATLALCLGVTAEVFKVGYAFRDITPPPGIPMWGYGARHDLPAEGTMDPLFAKCVVIETKDHKLALMGLDLGRSPTFRSMEIIREGIRPSGVDIVLISGSHTHHGPVIELIDKPGLGQGKFDNAIAYVATLERNIIEAINEAAAKTVPAKIGWASEDVPFNRNRQSKIEPKMRDPELAVLRFDTLDDKPIAICVNFAAHPVWADIMDRRWSSEWPGWMQKTVEEKTGAGCFFMQGAAGDMSPNGNGVEGYRNLGIMIGEKVLEINQRIQTTVPATPSIKAMPEERWDFESRVKLDDHLVRGVFKQAFFPEMMAMLEELPDNRVHPRLNTVLLNNELAIVGGSGEFFSGHSVRLKKESKAPKTLFFGYCNGHQMYFPTLAAIEEGGYGADATMSWVEPGAGEKMITKALENITTLLNP